MAAAIAATNPAPAAGIIVYTPDFFAAAQPGNAYEMIGRLPGFSFDGGDVVRGFGGAAGNVLVDGERPTSKSDTLDTILKRIPASRIERIELIRGGAPGIDMQGKTILANVVRKSGPAVTGMAWLGGGFGDGRKKPSFRFEAARKSGDRSIEGSLYFNNNFDDAAGDGPRLRTNAKGQVLVASNDDTQGASGNSTATVAYERPLAGGRLQLNGRFQTNHIDYRDDDRLVVPPGRQLTINRTDGVQGEAGIHYTRALGQRTVWEARIIQQVRQTSFGSSYADDTSTSSFSNDRTVGETIARAEATFAMSPGLSFQAGAEGAWNWLNSDSAYNANGAPVVLPAAKVRVEEKRGEAFATAIWKPAPKLNLEAGVRMEGSIISSSGDVTLRKSLYFLKPRLVATWSPRPSTQLRFRVEREVGQLNFDDFVASSTLALGTVSAGNPDLNPQTAWAVEAAFEQRFWSGGAFVATFKHAALSDVVDRAPVFGPSGPFDAPANIGDGRRDDLTVNLTLPLERLWIKRGLLKGKAIWRWSAVTDPANRLQREISNLRPSEWTLQFSQDLPEWKAIWGLDIYSGWRQRQFRFNEVQTTKLKHYVLLYGEVRPQPDLNFRIEFANASARGQERIREVYSSVGRFGDPDYTDVVNWGFGRMVYVRVRKTFG